MTTKKPKQPIVQEGPGPFGTRYVPPTQRYPVVAGKGVMAGRVGEIPPGSAKSVPIESFNISLFNVKGKFFAVKEACPHAEYPLTKGHLKGPIVSCASHNWQFDLRTGECLRGGEGVWIRTFPVDVVEDEVWIRV